MLRFRTLKLAFASLAVVSSLLTGVAQAKGPALGESISTITIAEMPQQGAQTYALIHQGGPFAHAKDGVVFGNRERLLPAQKRGFYHEYTVATPGSKNRGAKRIVCGGQPKAPEICYYTADHYASFRKIVP